MFYVIRPSAFPFCLFPLHPYEHLEKSIPWGPFCHLTHICCFLPIQPTKPFGKYYLTRNVTAKTLKFLLSVFLVDRKYLATLNFFLPKTSLLAPVTFNLPLSLFQILLPQMQFVSLKVQSLSPLCVLLFQACLLSHCSIRAQLKLDSAHSTSLSSVL